MLVTQRVFPRPGESASLGNLLEMSIHGPYPRATEVQPLGWAEELCVNTHLDDSYGCQCENHCPRS